MPKKLRRSHKKNVSAGAKVVKKRAKEVRKGISHVKKTGKQNNKRTKAVFRETEKARRKVLQLNKRQKRARNKIDPQTGEILSRYGYEKKYGRNSKLTPYKARILRGNLGRYYSLVSDYQDKQNEKRKRRKQKLLSKRDVMNSRELKQILIDLKKGLILKERGQVIEGERLMRNALKRSGRRDGVPDSVPVGESNSAREA